MNYYKRHLGDYAKDAGHLTMAEHGAYTLLLDRYYAVERAIPTAEAHKVCRARSQQERETVDAVLSEFFTESPAGWVNRRADEEIAAYNVKAERNRHVGRLGGRPAGSGNPNGSDTETQTVPGNNPSHKPLATSHKPEEAEAPPSPLPGADVVAAVLAAYHAKLPGCQRVGVVNPKRRKRILTADKLAQQVCREQGWVTSPLDFWTAYFTECSADPWMRGEVPNPKNTAWRQNLDVLLAEDRFAGIMDRAIEAMGSRDGR